MHNEEKEDRKLAVSEVYMRYDKVPKNAVIELVVRDTSGVPMLSFLEICRKLKDGGEFPRNIGATIKKNYSYIRAEEERRRIQDMENWVGRSGDFTAWFMRFLAKTVSQIRGQLYVDFWNMLTPILSKLDSSIDKKLAEQEVIEACEEILEEYLKEYANV